MKTQIILASLVAFAILGASLFKLQTQQVDYLGRQFEFEVYGNGKIKCTISSQGSYGWDQGEVVLKNVQAKNDLISKIQNVLKNSNQLSQFPQYFSWDDNAGILFRPSKPKVNFEEGKNNLYSVKCEK